MEHKKNFFLAVFWTLVITIACLVSVSKVPNVPVFGKDKTIHFFFYFVFSILWFLFLSKEIPKWTFAQKAFFIVASAFMYGGMIELCQEFFTSTRNADFYDVIANVSGSVIAILVLFLKTNLRTNSTSKNK